MDALGNVVATTDTPGVADATGYDAWGDPVGAGPSLEPSLGADGELQFGGLSDLRARTYDASLGQFTTADPLDGVDGSTTVATPYPYAGNDPIANHDPSGEQATDANAFYFGDS